MYTRARRHDCLHLVMLLVAMTSLPFISTQKELDYRCPGEFWCHCATLTPESHLIQLECKLRGYTMGNTSYIPGPLTADLIFNCRGAFYGSTYGYEFEHLSSLQILRIYECFFKRIDNHTFDGLSNLLALDLQDIGGPILGETLLKPLTSITAIRIADTVLGRLPDGFFCGLETLLVLNISHNFFTNELGIDFNDENPCLINTGILDVSGNLLGYLSPNLSIALPNLQEFYCSKCSIQKLQSTIFRNLTFLRVVDLSYNGIYHIPGDLWQDSPYIQVIDLQNNLIRDIPGTLFSNLSQMLSLNLSSNLLTQHDFETVVNSKMYGLQNLLLSNNAIRSIHNISLHPFTRLMSLDLSKNEISQISNYSFRYNTKLRMLNLSSNNIPMITLNSFDGLSSLLILDLSHNMLKTIGTNCLTHLSEISELYLQSNILDQFPNDINNLTSLILIDIGDNAISRLPYPSYVSILPLLRGIQRQGNNLTHLRENEFTWAPNLSMINLRYNILSNIHKDAFSGLSTLKFLILSYNMITTLEDILHPLNAMIYLDISNNEVRALTRHIWPSNSALMQLNISFNELTYVGSESFMYLDNLNIIDLRNNSIQTMTKGSLLVSPESTHQPQMYLGGNGLNCNCELSWLSDPPLDTRSYPRFPWVMDITDVYCTPTGIQPGILSVDDLDPSKYFCRYLMECTDLPCSCCQIESCPCASMCFDQPSCYMCPEGCVCVQNNDKTINIIDCFGNMTLVPSNIHPNASSFKLDGLDIRIIQSKSFPDSRKLEMLYLNGSHVENIEPHAFVGLQSIHSLYLQDNNMSCLHSSVSDGLTNLHNLYLHNNKLHHIQDGFLSSMLSLNILTLHSNRFEHLPNDIKEINSNLSRLTLSDNLWSCDCNHGPELKSWVISMVIVIPDYKNIWCHMKLTDNSNDSNSNSSKYNKDMHNVHHDNFTDYVTPHQGNWVDSLVRNCSLQIDPGVKINLLINEPFDNCFSDQIVREIDQGSSKQLQCALIVVSTLLIMAFVCTIIVFRYKEIISVWVFTKYGLRFINQNEELLRPYDGFVSYSSKDEAFVMDIFAPRLENERPFYQLLLHYRDWKVGASITESIIESVERSKRLIIILSENYVKSEWCNYEFKTAHHNVMKEKKNRIIVILLGNQIPDGLDKDLSIYLKANTYIRHNDPWFWDRIRYAMPDITIETNEDINHDGDMREMDDIELIPM